MSIILKKELVMCTTACIHLNERFIFARSLDLEYDFGDGVTLVPRNYPLRLRCKDVFLRHPAFIGMAKIVEDYPLLADGMNEYGLCVAGLRFPDSDAYGRIIKRGKTNLAPFEIIPYLLSMAKSTDEAVKLLLSSHIVDIPFNDAIENSPMHFHITDGVSGAIVELTDGIMHVYEDKAGVLTNSPPYPFQLYNLAHYLNIERGSPKISHGAHVFGSGLMAHGLPGDYSSTSRFAKAAWLCRATTAPSGAEAEVAESFIRAVSPPYGSVITDSGKLHYTRYIALMEPKEKSYTVKAFGNRSEKFKIEKESRDLDSLSLLNRITSF